MQYEVCWEGCFYFLPTGLKYSHVHLPNGWTCLFSLRFSMELLTLILHMSFLLAISAVYVRTLALFGPVAANPDTSMVIIS